MFLIIVLIGKSRSMLFHLRRILFWCRDLVFAVVICLLGSHGGMFASSSALSFPGLPECPLIFVSFQLIFLIDSISIIISTRKLLELLGWFFCYFYKFC